jgi:hypothetical protein
MKTTGHLEKVLSEINTEKELIDYIDSKENISEYTSFSEYYKSIPNVLAMENTDIYKLSDIDSKYCSHILSGSKKPGRDKVIRLCLAAKLDTRQVKRALEIAEAAPLYSRSRRDAVISYAIKKHLSVIDTNILLDESGLEPLS